MLATDGRNLGLLGYIGSGLDRMAGDMDRLEIGLPVLATIDESGDVIQSPFLADDDDAADMAFAGTVIEYALTNAGWCARVVCRTDPFFELAGHLRPLAQ